MTDTVHTSEETTFKWARAEAARQYQAPEAFLCVLSLAAAADHRMAALESDWLQQVTRRWWSSGVVGEKEVEALNFAVCARLGKEDALVGACRALPRACHAPVFAQALDLMLCNGPLLPEEAEFADLLERTLDLDAAEARRIRKYMSVKNAY